MSMVLDEGVPISVGNVFRDAGHTVHWFHEVFSKGSPDKLVSIIAQVNDWVLIASDGDMKRIAQSGGISNAQYKKLSLIKLSCCGPNAAGRVQCCMSLIEHEWNYGVKNSLDRYLFIDIGDTVIRCHR